MEQLHLEIKKLIVETLKLEDIVPEEIADEAPLFVEGLGLDSIDALELSVVLEKKYGVKFEDGKVAKAAFFSVKTLADFITSHSKLNFSATASNG